MSNENTPVIDAAECDSIRDAAQHDRFKGSKEFFTWIVATRNAYEHLVWTGRRSLREGAPFAEMALESVDIIATEPQPWADALPRPAALRVSPVVVDYALTAWRLVEAETRLELLNTIYPTVYGQECEELSFEGRDAVAVQSLWQWYRTSKAP